MALFKVSKGLKANLPSAKTEGYCWYTTDDSLFYIDYKDENGSLQRKALNAKDAETLTGASLSTILNSSDVEIPTSKAVLNALNEKLDKADAGSDWNQNDATKPDYVKNRPFYTGDPVETVMLPETTITIVSGGENLISSSFSYSFELGKTYVITFDGVDTEYTAYEVQGLVLVGDNFSSVAGGSGYVVMAKNESIVLNTMDSSLDGSHTIAIKIYNQEIVKVDEKYLPESAFTYAEWSKISNKIVDYKQQSLSLSVSGEQIPMRSGNSYSENKINDNLKFENGKTYEINGSITLHNPVGNNASVLNINGHYTCSNGEIVFGSCYDIHYKKDIRVSLYSSDSVIYQGMLCVSSAINVANTSFTFDINITVTGEAKQLPDICIGENIQRVGDDIILSSSTPDSTKQFKITVDDDYNVSATNTSDSVSKILATTEYVDNSVSNPLNITSATVGQIAKISAVDDTGKPTTWETINIPTPFKPEGKYYLTFSSPNSFTLRVSDFAHHWDGYLEYFASNKTWTHWNAGNALSAVDNGGEYVLYLRGIGNTKIAGDSTNYKWVLSGNNIKCIGNIENLLDYETVASGNHPTMADRCYANMFYGCAALTQAPALPATTLTNGCYRSMFQDCTSLTQAPSLPATTLADWCYAYMFRGCTSLTQAPYLPATTLSEFCYQQMFLDCASLTQAPALPATTLTTQCYYQMFRGCTSLTQAPYLPATTLAQSCYASMFYGCTSLTKEPLLPATTLADSCYQQMFYGCTSLKLSSTQTEEYTQEYRIPTTGTGTTATDALSNMFTNTGGNFMGAPEINTTYYLSTDNMIVHETEIATLREYVESMIDSPFKPAGKSYLTFSSPNSFTLAVNDATKHWDGTLEYFASNKTWTTWDGTTTLSSVDNDGDNVLYLRGIGNTVITGNGYTCYWVLTGTDIKCIGNIENLLDYATVTAGNHPTMADYCYNSMFFNCTSLVQAPDLPATTLANYCYWCMFSSCTSLTQAPALPATTLAKECYASMFNNCTSIIQAPALPATTLADYCYDGMFLGCASLTHAPALPATTLVNDCYRDMFKNCTALTQAPALPATTLTDRCYWGMFQGCTSLIQAPVLRATTLTERCYWSMFYDCISLTQAPALPATTLANECYASMFRNCTSLTQAPALPATTLAEKCYYAMFLGCASLTHAPVLPAITLANECYGGMFKNCTSIKLSSTNTGEYTQEYRIPTTGTGTVGTNSLANMFESTGGTFTGNPEINTTYYLSTDNMIVRETEVATLNGYVGSMIDAAIGNAIGGSY